MDMKVTFLVISHLLTVNAASDPFWNLLQVAINQTVSDGSGVINGTKDAENQDSNDLHWNFGIEIGQGQMIRLKFLLQGNYDKLTLALGETETFVKVGVSCYYFTRTEQTDAQCEATAMRSGCEFVNLTTTHLNLFYKSDDKPQFVFDYEYMDCLGNPLLSSTTTATTTATAATIATTTTTNSPTTADSTIMTNGLTPANSTTTTTSPTTVPSNDQTTRNANSTAQNIGVRANVQTDEAQNPDVTAQSTSAPSTVKTIAQSAAIDTNIIIIVVVVVILLVLIVLLLLVCGKRFRRYKKQLKELHSGKFSNVGNSEAPPIDPLYEEIAPQLPLRNLNMSEPGYEVPLCAMGSTQEGSSSQSSLTVENELYLKRLDDETQPTSKNNSTKYGTVENELYHEDSATDDEINANIVTKDTKGVTLTNELYAASKNESSVNHKQETVNGVNERPQTPQVPATADSELEASVNDSSTVNNVLYNL